MSVKINVSKNGTRFRSFSHTLPPQKISVNPAFFAEDTSLYAPEGKGSYVLRNILLGLNSLAVWFDPSNIESNEDETRASYFSHHMKPPECLLTFHARYIPFVNIIKDHGVIVNKKITCRPRIEMIEAKALKACIRTERPKLYRILAPLLNRDFSKALYVKF
jgi:hypothetical protein